MGLTQLQGAIDEHLPTKNIPYAIRVKGTFTLVKTRSVPAQNRPYRPLSAVVKEQSVFFYQDIPGTLVGFYVPEYMSGVNMPGYHLHFLSSDHTRGGHVLDCLVKNATVSIDACDQLQVVMPRSAEFYGLNLTNNPDEVLVAEKGRQ